MLHEEDENCDSLDELIITKHRNTAKFKTVQTSDDYRPTRVCVNQHPERDMLLKKPEGRGSMKAVIISDSTTKRINMTRFNNQLLHGTALKRDFPGATASQLDYYMKASLAEDKPGQIIICGGGG